jgi:hypothetical protein
MGLSSMTDPRQQLVQDLGVAAIKSAPPVTVAAMTLNQWVAVATIAYIALQACYLVWKWRRDSRRASAIDKLMDGPVAQPGDRAPR